MAKGEVLETKLIKRTVVKFSPKDQKEILEKEISADAKIRFVGYKPYYKAFVMIVETELD